MSHAAMRSMIHAAACLVLAGCLGEKSHPPVPGPPDRPQVSGTVSDGRYAGPQGVAGKGAAGLPRSVRSGSSGAYVLSLSNLTGPYLLANTLTPNANPDITVMTSLALGPGTANITPLTTLLTAQLLGATPAGAIAAFDSGLGGLPALVSDATIAAAQADVAGFLADVHGLDVGTASFIATPFSAVAGDPMFDAIVALNEALTGSGTSLGSLAAQLASGARACQNGILQVSFTGGARRFCAVFRTTLEDEQDATITSYRFRNAAGETLLLRARDTTVLAVQFERAGGTLYQCAATACAGIGFDPAQEDGSRYLDFAATTLVADGANLVLTGRLRGGIPGLELPSLPCADNRFHVVFGDNGVIGDCISLANDPFSMGGNFGADVAPGRTSWSLSNSDNPQPGYPAVQIVLDVSGATPSVVSLYYYDYDPDTFEIRNAYLCRVADCNGIAIGPATVDTTTAPGYAISRRGIEFEGTLLAGYQADGTPTGSSATFTGSFVLLSTPNELDWPSTTSCGAPADAIGASVAGAQFQLCIPPNDIDNGSWYRYVYDNGDGTLQVVAVNESYDQVLVLLDQGVVTEVTANVSGATFQCRAAACAGVTLSAADANGNRELSLAGTLLPNLESYPLPGDRVLRLDVTALPVPLYQ